MCPQDVVDICILRRNEDNRLMGAPIIELEFEKDILDPYIIFGGEKIQLRMKKDREQKICKQYTIEATIQNKMSCIPSKLNNMV